MLHVAAEKGHNDVIKTLLSSGADHTAKSNVCLFHIKLDLVSRVTAVYSTKHASSNSKLFCRAPPEFATMTLDIDALLQCEDGRCISVVSCT